MKIDFSDMAHEEPKTEIPRIARVLISAGGGQPDTVFKYCSLKEIADFKILGAVLIGSAVYTSINVTTGLYLAWGDGAFSVLLLVIGLAIGVFQALVDHTTQYAGSLYIKGYTELKNCGLKLPAPGTFVSISRFIRFARGIQAALFGLLGGLFFVIAANSGDIAAHNSNKFRTDNRTASQEVAKTVDARITRSKDDLKQLTVEVGN